MGGYVALRCNFNFPQRASFSPTVNSAVCQNAASQNLFKTQNFFHFRQRNIPAADSCTMHHVMKAKEKSAL